MNRRETSQNTRRYTLADRGARFVGFFFFPLRHSSTLGSASFFSWRFIERCVDDWSCWVFTDSAIVGWTIAGRTIGRLIITGWAIVDWANVNRTIGGWAIGGGLNQCITLYRLLICHCRSSLDLKNVMVWLEFWYMINYGNDTISLSLNILSRPWQ